jgi:uncharacterized UBP type Zn finger protein
MSVKQASECPHMAGTNATALKVSGTQCEECGLNSPTRVCMTCGHIGCCESMRGHARAHALDNDHPLIRELTGRERAFTWCYGCNAYIE